MEVEVMCHMNDFTYPAYKNLICMLKENGYEMAKYDSFKTKPKSCILRHDVDLSIGKALDMAEFESRECGVRSAYFVLATSSFYNIFHLESRKLLCRIMGNGHDIGLHFDETQYELNERKELYIECIQEELSLLEKAVGVPINSVSMHRPSKFVLENDIIIPGVVNTYSTEFFNTFKYLSDSRMHWRENVEDAVSSNAHDKLHILMHPFWYSNHEQATRNKLLAFISSAQLERYDSLNANFRDLSEFVERSEVDLQ